MKFTKDWLEIHLKSKKKESQIIDKLNNIGLEVEKIEPIKNELSDFIIAKIIKAAKFDAKFNSFDVAVDSSNVWFLKIRNNITKNDPVPGPKKPS